MPISNSRCVGWREQWASGQVQLVGATTYGPFYPGCCTRARIVIERTTSAGAETMDAKLQHADGSGDLVDLLDHAGNAIAFHQWADDSHVNKTLEVGIGVTSGDPDDTITFGTTHKLYNVSLPSEFYIVVTGASGTSDTFSAYNDYLP